MAQGAPQAGEIYRHFKNKLYQIITVATHSETGEKYVVYQALYGHFQTYLRPYDMFISEVDRAKYPQADQQYRFTLVEFGSQPKPEEGDIDVNPWLLRFLDTDTMEEKLKILEDVGGEMTDRLVDDCAAALDLVIPEGELLDRVQQLRRCIRTKVSYEQQRFR